MCIITQVSFIVVFMHFVVWYNWENPWLPMLDHQLPMIKPGLVVNYQRKSNHTQQRSDEATTDFQTS